MRKKILVISPEASHPQNRGNRARIYSLLSNLKKMGHEIHFFYVELFDRHEYLKQSADIKAMEDYWNYFYIRQAQQKFLGKIDKNIGRLGIFLRKTIPGFNFRLKPDFQMLPVQIDSWYPKDLDKKLAKLNRKIKFDVVIVEYVFLSKALESFGENVLKVIDTHDRFGGLYKLYEKHGYKFGGIYLSPTEEAKGLNRADIIIAIQDKEKGFFSKITNKKIVTIGHTIPLYNQMQRKSIGKKILFVGANIPPNKDGINYFIREIFPEIRSEFPDTQLMLAGAICGSVKDCEGIIKLGEVKDIKMAYSMIDLVINPVKFGSGLKIKSIEALSYAKPLITTSHGAIGLEDGAGEAFLVADTTTDFTQAVVGVLSDVNLYNTLSHNAYNFAYIYNQKNIAKLKKLFE